MRQALRYGLKAFVMPTAILLMAPALTWAGDASTPSVTPQQLIEQVRARLFDRAQLRIGPKTAVDIGCVHRFASR